METREQLLTRIAAFRVAHNLSERQFCLDAVGDHRFVSRLRRGKATLALIERAEAFMRENSCPEEGLGASESLAADAA